MQGPERLKDIEPVAKRYAQQRGQALADLRIIPGSMSLTDEVAVLNPHKAPASEVDSQESLVAKVNEVNRSAHQATWNTYRK